VAYAYVNSTSLTQAASSSIETNAYSPTAGNSLILAVAGGSNGMPYTGTGGTGNPGDGVNTYTFLGIAANNGGAALPTVTFTAAPSGTSATLTASFSGTTGTYTGVFSDGEWRAVSLTNSQTTCTWSGALVGSPGTTLVYCTYANSGVGNNLNLVALYQAVNVSGSNLHPGAGSAAGGDFTAVALYEYSGIAAGTAFSGFAWNNQIMTGGGTAANAVVSGNVNVLSQPGMLFGISGDINGTTGISAGTSPIAFTGRGTIWTSWVGEDAAIAATGNAQATFTGTGAYDTYQTLAAYFPNASGSSAAYHIDGARITANVNRKAGTSYGLSGAGLTLDSSVSRNTA
jgi:hypothetical protein